MIWQMFVARSQLAQFRKHPVRPPLIDEHVSTVVGPALQHTDGNFFESTNDPVIANTAETTPNARAGFETDGGLRVMGRIKNLTNVRRFADKLELFGTVYATTSCRDPVA